MQKAAIRTTHYRGRLRINSRDGCGTNAYPCWGAVHLNLRGPGVIISPDYPLIYTPCSRTSKITRIQAPVCRHARVEILLVKDIYLCPYPIQAHPEAHEGYSASHTAKLLVCEYPKFRFRLSGTKYRPSGMKKRPACTGRASTGIASIPL